MENEQTTRKRWWGWGEFGQDFPLDDKPDFFPYLRRRFGQPLAAPQPAPDFSSLSLPESALRPTMRRQLSKIVTAERISTDPFIRLSRSIGKSYRDLLGIRQKCLGPITDVVVFPDSSEQVFKLLRFAAEHAIVVIPFGGGSSVVGGLEPAALPGQPGPLFMTLDLALLNRVRSVNPLSLTAKIEAGIFGPALESALQSTGFSLGHFPQSFEFSTLGGWIATRSAGQQSTLYGKIEQMVAGLTLVSPAGIFKTSEVPATATGPEFRQLLIGSEGTLGVITEATMKIHSAPEQSRYRGLIFKNFYQGTQAVRTIMQLGLTPAAIRLSDPEETSFAYRLRPAAHDLAHKLQEGVLWSIGQVGYSFEHGSLMILGFEGPEELVMTKEKLALEVCRDFGGLNLGQGVGRHWFRDRFRHPYMRDTLLNYGIMLETLETATSWSNLPKLYEQVSQAIRTAMADLGEPGIVMSHLSHSYQDGTSLYFIFLSRQCRGQELAQWRQVKEIASDAILAAGGTISHHHGVGLDHAPWFAREHGQLGETILGGLKEKFDPAGIMNPCKIIRPR
jgi:alkyldihydroxyacetonephosphate synthase